MINIVFGGRQNIRPAHKLQTGYGDGTIAFVAKA